MTGAFAALCERLWPTVVVERAHPDFDVVSVRLAPSLVEPLLLSRNNFFSLAWVCRQVSHRGLTSVSVTLKIPRPDGTQNETVIEVPDRARKPFYAAVERMAAELKWDGVCPRPAQQVAYRC